MAFQRTVTLFLCFNCINNSVINRHHDVPKRSINDSPNNYKDSGQLIELFGYKSENHSPVTKDGYKLQLFRIPRKGPPVLLVHGIGDSSDAWLVMGDKHGMAYLMAQAGFDVWLFNARGNRYSKEKISSITEKKYWNFTYEEMGTQDLPATIDYILQTTLYKKLTYIGFSQGTTIFLVMCSMKPEYNEKIKHAYLLAPVAKISKIKYPFIEFVRRNLNFLTILAEVAPINEVFPWNSGMSDYLYRICRHGIPERVICDLGFYTQFGLLTDNVPMDKFPVISSHLPAGTSAKVFLHFIQGYANKRFQRYDYGVNQNLKRYSSRTPPDYNVTLVSAPVTLIVSQSDWFTVEEDVLLLRSRLPNIVNDIVIPETNNFTHLEFIYGSRARSMIYEPLMKLML